MRAAIACGKQSERHGTLFAAAAHSETDSLQQDQRPAPQRSCSWPPAAPTSLLKWHNDEPQTRATPSQPTARSNNHLSAPFKSANRRSFSSERRDYS